MRIYLLLLFLSISFHTLCQNLVPNPSFEEFSLCPNNWGSGYYWDNWISIGSIENYNLCGTNGFEIPENPLGYQVPLSGNGYGGLGMYWKGGTVLCEFIESPLNSGLIFGKTYNVSFNVSLADSIYYSIGTICAYLSPNYVITDQDFQNLNNVSPQICSTRFISDKVGWTNISGRYTALGGERYLIIGNFNTSENTDTLNVGGGILITPPTNFNEYSYYYIDDVSVTPVDSLNEIEENEFIPFTLYPNPAENQVSIQSSSPKQFSYSVSNKLGQQVLQGSFTKETHIETSALPAGIYFVEAGGSREKLVVWR